MTIKEKNNKQVREKRIEQKKNKAINNFLKNKITKILLQIISLTMIMQFIHWIYLRLTCRTNAIVEAIITNPCTKYSYYITMIFGYFLIISTILVGLFYGTLFLAKRKQNK